MSSNYWPFRGGHGVQTVYRDSARKQSRTYAKGFEMLAAVGRAAPQDREALRLKAEAERGTVRFELQLRSRYLKDHAMQSLSSLTDDSIERVARKHFQDSGYAAPLGGGHGKVRAVAALLRATGEEKVLVPMLGQLYMDGLGEQGGSSTVTRDKYRKIAKRCGLTPLDLLEPKLDVMRLDWNSGLVEHQPD